MAPRRTRIPLLLAIAGMAASLGIASLAQAASPDSYPSVDAATCEDGYGGAFAGASDTRTCTLETTEGRIVYTSSGGEGLDFVQTTWYPVPSDSPTIQLGPATVACSNPGNDPSGAWALDCM